MDLIFSFHALQQMFKRNISVEQVKYAILNGEEIRSYPDDKPYPSKLLLAYENELPLHIVIAQNSVENKTIVHITQSRMSGWKIIKQGGNNGMCNLQKWKYIRGIYNCYT